MTEQPGPTPDWNTVELRWRGSYLDGTPVVGMITVAPAINRFLDDDPATPRLILGKTLSAELDTNGEAVFSVPVTDDPEITPNDFTYLITEALEDAEGQSYTIEAPLASQAEGIELVRSVPVPVSEGTPVSLVGRAEFDAVEARVDTLEAGGGGGGVSSVNGFTGVVVLTAADVGARPDTYVPAWTEVTGKPATFPPEAHNQTAATITDFSEAVQDVVATLLSAGSNITLNYDDAGNLLTITSTDTQGSYDPELVRDTIGVALVGAGLISVTVNDAADTITISTTATANATDAQLRDRATHTGTQAIATVTDLQTTLDGKADDAHTHDTTHNHDATYSPIAHDHDKYVAHNVEAAGVYPARPTATVVFWIGGTDPGASAVNGDVWIDTTP